MIVAAAAALPRHFEDLHGNLLVLEHWPDPDAQHRLASGQAYDFLRTADAVLPADASVLLLTSGRDVRHREYTAFHRALYLLTPRPVWWMTPAPPDGTWESRWWISAPLDGAAIRAVVDATHASHLLAFELPAPPPVGEKVADLPGGAIFAVAPGPRSAMAPVEAVRVPHWWGLRLGAALLVIVLLGHGAVALIARCGYQARGLEAAALSWTLGAGLTSLAMFWLDAFGARLGRQVAAVTLVALGGAAVMRWLDPRAPPSPVAPPSNVGRVTTGSRLLSIFLIGVLGTLMLVVTVSAVGRPLTAWDSWVLWGMRARAMFVEGGISRVIYADPSRAVTLLGYPLLLPLLEAWTYAWLGAPDDRLVGAVCILFYAALPAIAYAALARRGAGGAFALAASVALAAIPVLVRLAGNVMADVPAALFATVAAIYLVEWLEGRGAGTLLVAALCAGFLTWTKREGVVLVGALIVASLLGGRASRRARHGVLALACGALLVGGPWYAFAFRHAIPGPQFEAVTPAHFAANLHRLPSIAWHALATLGSPDASCVWPLAVVFALLARRHLVPLRPSALFPLTALLYLAVMGLGYVFSAYAPYQQHVVASFSRLAAQVVPLPLLWIAYHATVEGTGPDGGGGQPRRV
jgi:hypothetical protein